MHLIMHDESMRTVSTQGPLCHKLPLSSFAHRQEVDELCAEWKPEPLAPALTPTQQISRELVITSASGSRVVVDGKSVVTFASADFVGLSALEHGQAICAEAIDKYGVGACGPRGFYGTIDVHLELEAEIAKFMGTEEAILYSYDCATLPSIIPVFANAKDLIVCDEVRERGRVAFFKG